MVVSPYLIVTSTGRPPGLRVPADLSTEGGRGSAAVGGAGSTQLCAPASTFAGSPCGLDGAALGREAAGVGASPFDCESGDDEGVGLGDAAGGKACREGSTVPGFEWSA